MSASSSSSSSDASPLLTSKKPSRTRRAKSTTKGKRKADTRTRIVTINGKVCDDQQCVERGQTLLCPFTTTTCQGSVAVPELVPFDGDGEEDHVQNYVDQSYYQYDDQTVVDKQALHAHDQEILRCILDSHRTDVQPMLDPRRRCNVTASDIASICGENPYETPHSVLMKKMLHITNFDNENTRHGKKYEPVAIGIVSTMTIDGSKVKAVYYVTYMNHPTYQWIGGTLDGIIELMDGRVFVLEVKCPLKRRIEPGTMPAYYMSQIQTYMYITGLHACVFMQYKPRMTARTKERVDLLLVRRDDQYMPLRLPLLKEFRDKMLIAAYIQEERCTAMANLMKYLWIQRRNRRAVPDHQCSVVSSTNKRLFFLINYTLVMHMCKMRLSLINRPFDISRCENDALFVHMYNELCSTTHPIRPCECMLGDVLCSVYCPPSLPYVVTCRYMFGKRRQYKKQREQQLGAFQDDTNPYRVYDAHTDQWRDDGDDVTVSYVYVGRQPPRTGSTTMTTFSHQSYNNMNAPVECAVVVYPHQLRKTNIFVD